VNKFLAIVRREYVETVRTRAFMVSTLLTPLLMSVMIFIPQVLARSTPDTQLRVVVIDRTGSLLAPLDQELVSDPNHDLLNDGSRRIVLAAAEASEVSGPPEHPGGTLQRAGAGGLLYLGPGVLTGQEEPIYYSENVADFSPIRRLERALNVVLPRLRLEGAGITRERIDAGIRPADLRTRKIGKDGKVEDREFLQEWMTAIFLTVGLYAPTLMAGFALSRGLLEEKANRVMEVLISSVTPTQLMSGKILGQALVVLSQMLLWFLAGTALYLRGAPGGGARDVLSSFSPTLLAYLVVYFLLGYFLYAALFAGVGAVCTSETEAQQVQTPLVMMLIVPIVVAMAIVRHPDSGLAVTLSMIPFFASNVMLMRMSLQPPPVLQIVASIVILLFAIGVVFWAVSKIFRVGILMTGKRMTVPEMIRWLRAA
jgi:ABC-2 type transport system permease protein